MAAIHCLIALLPLVLNVLATGDVFDAEESIGMEGRDLECAAGAIETPWLKIGDAACQGKCMIMGMSGGKCNDQGNSVCQGKCMIEGKSGGKCNDQGNCECS